MAVVEIISLFHFWCKEQLVVEGESLPRLFGLFVSFVKGCICPYDIPGLFWGADGYNKLMRF